MTILGATTPIGVMQQCFIGSQQDVDPRIDWFTHIVAAVRKLPARQSGGDYLVNGTLVLEKEPL